MTVEGSPAAPPHDPRTEHDAFAIVQKLTAMVNRYEVSTVAEDGRSPAAPVCFVEQKRMAMREDLRAFTDAGKTEEVFRIKAKQVFDPRARYDVTAPSGAVVGQLQKVFGKSLFRSTWRIYDAGGEELAWAHERRLWVAIVRRVVGLIPFVGDFADWLPFLYHFDFYAGDEHIATLERIRGLRDRYVLTLPGDPERRIDRRLVVAIAVGMDALQAR